MGLLNVKGKGFEYSTCKTNCERFEEILAATSTRAEPKCVQLPGADADAWQQERQVRLTAQRILSDHLRKPDDNQQLTSHSETRFWDQMSLDLTGATLIDFNLAHCMVTGDAWFSGATFSGNAVFDRATFTGRAWFGGANFSGSARFDEATFTGSVVFELATFSDSAWFGKAIFTGGAVFDEATFSGNARFGEATFAGVARFGGANFSGSAMFNRATFSSGAVFDGATFSGSAVFDGATFSGGARFGGATFTGSAVFDGATVDRGPDAFHFADAHVHSPDARHVWPRGWHLESDTQGKPSIVRGADPVR